MDAWNTGSSRKQQSSSQAHVSGALDPATITQQYQNLRYYNYLQYVQQMRLATGDNSQDPLGLSYQEQVAGMQAVTIEGLPPGRPQSHENGRPKLTRANTTYGEYRRTQHGDEPIGFDNPTAQVHQQRSRVHDPRDKHKNGRQAASAKVDDGWGDDEPCRQSSRKLSKPTNDWDDDAEPTREAHLKSNINWDDSEDIKSSAGKNNDWDDGSPDRKPNLNTATIDWGLPDDPAPISNKSATSKQNNGSSYQQEVSSKGTNDWDDDIPSTTAEFSTENQVIDWGDIGDVGEPAPAKKRQLKTDDWSDHEDSTPAKKFHSEKKNNYQGSNSGRGGFKQSREGSYGSRNSSEGHGSRHFSREPSRSYHGRDSGSREGSKDRHRSDSRASFGRDRPPRQPREGDWDCSKCKNNNFSFRTECFRCQEPKGEDVKSSSGSFHSRENSRSSYRGDSRGRGYNGGSRGGSRGGFKNKDWGGGGARSLYSDTRSDIRPAKSGWSDDKDDEQTEKKTETAPVVNSAIDWDDDVVEAKAGQKRHLLPSVDDRGTGEPVAKKSSTEVAKQSPKKVANDLWDTIEHEDQQPIVSSEKSQKSSANDDLDDSWGSPKVETKLPQIKETIPSNSDDEWD